LENFALENFGLENFGLKNSELAKAGLRLIAPWDGCFARMRSTPAAEPSTGQAGFA
jgi:hypothetical protein